MDENKNENIAPQSEYDKENATEKQEKDINGEADVQTHKEVNEEEIKKASADKSHLSSKIARLERELAKALEERDSFKDSYQRTFSDYNNYKKRNQSLASQAVRTGTCDAIERILPVLDNLERALEHVNEQSDDAVSKGIAMVYKQLSDIIAAMEVREIPALGYEFDPNFHHAIQQVEAKEGDTPGTVAAVVQKGYMLDNRILRHSMVIVNK